MIPDNTRPDGIFGKWLTDKKIRCDHCGMVRKRIMVVSAGDCTGNFCSENCFRLAKEAMNKG